MAWRLKLPSERVGYMPFVGADKTALYTKCKAEFQTGGIAVRERQVELTTLNNVTACISVRDSRCPIFQTIAPYDGRDSGIFCISERNAVTRELLDTWMYDVCCIGNTFRDAFASWKSKATSLTAIENSNGLKTSLKRRQGSKAFALFLSRLKFPKKEELDTLFSCRLCGRQNEDGSRTLDAIVMDGTATGILGELPKFQRKSEVVTVPSTLPECLYIMPSPKLRAFVDVIFKAAFSNGQGALFTVSLSAFSKEGQSLLVRAFFSPEGISKENASNQIRHFDNGTQTAKRRKRKQVLSLTHSHLQTYNAFVNCCLRCSRFQVIQYIRHTIVV